MIITLSAAGGGKLPSEFLLYGYYLYLKIGFLVVIVNLSSLDEKGGVVNEVRLIFFTYSIVITDIPGMFA